jgi:hypothetical protein
MLLLIVHVWMKYLRLPWLLWCIILKILRRHAGKRSIRICRKRAWILRKLIRRIRWMRSVLGRRRRIRARRGLVEEIMNVKTS